MYHNFFSIQIDLFIKSLRDSNMDVVPIKMLSRATLHRIMNMSFTWFNSGALAREARSGAPWVRKCGKLPIQDNLLIT